MLNYSVDKSAWFIKIAKIIDDNVSKYTYVKHLNVLKIFLKILK